MWRGKNKIETGIHGRVIHMMKVVIADDEQRICQLIQMLVDWEKMNMEVAAVVHNGIDAVEAVRKYQPDVMITDIKMPGYDGLEMISRAKEISPKLEFIIISGYRNFNYAQQAIKYGVKDYLLKPIGKQELNDVLQNIAIKYREREEALSQEEALKIKIRNSMDRIRVDALKLFLSRRYPLEDFSLDTLNKTYHFQFQAEYFRIAVIKLDGIYHIDKKEREYLEHKMIQILEYRLRPVCIDMECCIEPEVCCVLMNYKKTEDIRKHLNGILEELLLQKEILEHLQVTIGLGVPVEHVTDIYRSQKSSFWAVEQRLIEGTDRIIEGAEESSNAFVDSRIFREFNTKMVHALEKQDIWEVQKVLSALKEDLLNEPGINGHEILQMAKEAVNLYLFQVRRWKYHSAKLDGLFEEFDREIQQYGSVDGIFRYLNRLIVSSFKEEIALLNEAEIKPVREVKRYIEENYQKPITLEMVSAEIGFNASYFSTLFKKEMNVTFSEYLQEYRINQAKKLLKETNYNIQTVGEMVGYSDVKSFKKVFEKYSGLNPKDFRKLYA